MTTFLTIDRIRTLGNNGAKSSGKHDLSEQKPLNGLNKIRKKIISRYYMRPTYILKKLWAARKQPKVIKNYILYGLRLIKNLF